MALLFATSASADTYTVTLHRTTLVHTKPHGVVNGAVNGYTPITYSPTVLPVKAVIPGWYEVRLPKRPDGAHGWISAQNTTLGTTPWEVKINRETRRVRIYFHEHLDRTYRAIVGRPSLPTPTGIFFVTEIFADQGSVSGPYALATSAYSNELTEFDEGPGQIAMHGREGLSGAIGTASSHGCIRFENADITWLAWHLLPGTPVIIV